MLKLNKEIDNTHLWSLLIFQCHCVGCDVGSWSNILISFLTHTAHHIFKTHAIHIFIYCAFTYITRYWPFSSSRTLNCSTKIWTTNIVKHYNMETCALHGLAVSVMMNSDEFDVWIIIDLIPCVFICIDTVIGSNYILYSICVFKYPEVFL